MDTKYPPIQPGTAVKTTAPNMALKDQWTVPGWNSRKWGIQGKVFDNSDSHGLCYGVMHEDGTEAWYDPSELVEVAIPMQSYLLTAKAKWISSCEHPRGKSDIHTPESSTLSVEIEAPDLKTARTVAKNLLAAFEAELPKKREGSLSWQNEDAKIVSTTFAQILEL